MGWTGLAPWEFELPFPGSLTSSLLGVDEYDGAQMMKNDEGEQTLNQLLACMDGIDTKVTSSHFF